jgi:hypothetical protein
MLPFARKSAGTFILALRIDLTPQGHLCFAATFAAKDAKTMKIYHVRTSKDRIEVHFDKQP